jgi:hypothetical protein
MFRSRFVACVALAGALFGLLGPTTGAQEKKDDQKPTAKVEKKTYEF